MVAIRAEVASRVYAAGDRLPSIRAMATSLGVSPSTVVDAYDRLSAEGVVRARRGSGFYVASPLGSFMAPRGSRPKPERGVDPFWISRQSLDAVPGVLKPGCGWLPNTWMPNDALRKAIRTLARVDEGALTEYGGTRGSVDLRHLLHARFVEDGLDLALDQIMLTGSGTQSLDLVCRRLVRQGDTVLLDDPCYFNFGAVLRTCGARIVSVPYTPTGPDIGMLEAVLASEKPRLYITNSAIHNPTGATLSPQNAYRVLSLATSHDLTIVEDDIFSDFEPEPSPRLSVLDNLNRVIRIGSFSKTLSASLRCGYIAAEPDLLEELVDVQIGSSFCGPSPFAAQMIADVLTSGQYRKHMNEVRLRLVRTRREVSARLDDLGLRIWSVPRGGFYLWCQLPEGRNAADVARLAVEAGVILAPGNAFSTSGNSPDFLRFNVAHSKDPRVWQVMKQVLNRPSRDQ